MIIYLKKKVSVSFSIVKIMKKLSTYVFLVLLFFGNIFAKSIESDDELNQLFDQLKKINDASIAFKVEIDIRGIFRYVNAYPTALDMVSSGKVSIDTIISHHFELQNVADAFTTARNAAQGVMKVIVTI